MSWDAQIGYENVTSPDGVYDIVAGGSYHDISEDYSYSGEQSYHIDLDPSERNKGNAWLALDNSSYSFNVNSNGHAEELWGSIQLYIPPSFDITNAAQRSLTAAISHSAGGGHSGGGNPDGTNGWSVRYSILGPGQGSQGEGGYGLSHYVYNIDTDNDYNAYYDVLTDGWNNLVFHIKCNTWSGNSANADGVSELWVDGDQIFSTDSWRWTHTDDNMIEYSGVTAFGDANGDIYYDNHWLATGAEDPRDGSDPDPDPEPDPDPDYSSIDENFNHEDISGNYSGETDAFEVN